MTALSLFLQELLRPETLQTYGGLLEHLRRFFDPTVDEKDRVCCDYGKTPNVAVKAVKSVGHAAIAAPGAIINTVGNVVDGTLGKAFSVRILFILLFEDTCALKILT